MTNTNLPITKTIIGQADDLAAEHENLGTHIAIGRQMLYELLAKIYQLSEQLEVAADKEDLVKSMRWDLAKHHKIKTQSNSSATGVLVRYVTRADRKNVHVYARAIETARVQGISAQDLPKFFQQQGGLEQIRAIGVAKERITSNEEALDIATKTLRAVAEKPFSIFELNESLNEFGATCIFDYFIAMSIGGKKYAVVAKINANDEFENKTLLAFANALDLQNPESKAKILAMIERSKKVREKRYEHNKNKPFKEQFLLKGEFPQVQQEQFDVLFEAK